MHRRYPGVYVEADLLPGFTPTTKEMIQSAVGSAEISHCGLYRRRLWRIWSTPRQERLVLFIMLNPSTADASEDDPTIRRCMRFAYDWGFGGMEVRNLFSYRATDPEHLYTISDPIGPGNEQIIQLGEEGLFSRIVAAWGNHGKLHGRGAAVLKDLTSRHLPVYHLGLTKEGELRHPLYLPADVQPVAFKLDQRPISEVITELGTAVPDEEWAKVPEDLSSNLDHYLYEDKKNED